MRLHATILLTMFTASAAYADDEKSIEINGTGRKVTETCTADTVVTINGSGHSVKLSGPCAHVIVNGTGQDVAIERAVALDVNGTNQKVGITTAGAITVNGLKNKVTWEHAIEGKKPSITSNGMGNSVVELTPAKAK